jgi:DNA transformation protein
LSGSKEFRDYVLDQLSAIDDLSARAMFGGFGIFQDGLMFALIARDTLYFKVDETNRSAFEQAGMPPFRYTRGNKVFEMSYWQAPPDILDDASEISEWARVAIAAAHSGQSKKSKT